MGGVFGEIRSFHVGSSTLADDSRVRIGFLVFMDFSTSFA
jgi:hypothetical protein